MAAVGLQSINLRRATSCGFSSILLEEQLEANAMLAKEICVIQNWTVIKCVSRFATCSTGSSSIKVFVGSHHIDTAVLQIFKVIEARRDGDVVWIVIVEGD